MKIKEGMINHGAQILLDYRHNRRWGKIKSWFTLAFWKGVLGLSAILFFVAGLFSADVLLTHLV